MHKMSRLMSGMYRPNKLFKMCNRVQFIQWYLRYKLSTSKWSDNILESTGYLCTYMSLFMVRW